MTDQVLDSMLGRDISHLIPPADGVPGIVAMPGRDQEVWERAVGHLHVRDNDVHTIYAYGLATALLSEVPEARADIVLPAIILHDTGWSAVPEAQVLEAIAPAPRHPELVPVHEAEGARIASEILADLRFPEADAAEIAGIVDGHDTRMSALSASDACVKDADKLWRLTPHGLSTVQRWFGLNAGQALRLVSVRTHDHLCTDAGRAMARVLAAVASVNLAPQRLALNGGQAR
ncbi:MAG TPA: HD domain-containing protein [Trebonia sp.]|nr:HD domain-containing protein [Trebonia sp.]